MFYQNEIASVEGYGKKYDIKLKPEEVKLANQLVESLSAPFKPAQYRDEFQARLSDLIEAKLKGREVIAAPKAPHRAPVIDMMEALKKSLAAGHAGKREAKVVSVAPAHRTRRKAS
jgi:DNA end-binding protein Ku